MVPLEPIHFDFMQHGINQIAAKAARDGITATGHRYKPPTDPVGSGRLEHHRREAMERAWLAPGQSHSNLGGATTRRIVVPRAGNSSPHRENAPFGTL